MDNLKAYFAHPLLTFGSALMSKHTADGIVIDSAAPIITHELGHLLLAPDPLLPHWGLSDPDENKPFAVKQGGELLDLEIRVVAAQLAICKKFDIAPVSSGLLLIVGADGLNQAEIQAEQMDIDALWAEAQLKLKRA